MRSFEISLPNYAAEFERTISVPVKEDPAMPLSDALKAALAPGTNFSFKLDDAIVAGDRYLAIQGQPPNPVQILRDWVNMLRWEVSSFWKSPDGDWYDRQPLRGGPVSFSWEHPKRGGELLAQGIAILFLEKRLGLARSRFFFLDGSSARPDFLVRLERSEQRAVLLKNRSRMGLEVRSRARVASVPKGDRDDIRAKKAGLSGTLAIYCAYGGPSPVKGRLGTRIVLADPTELTEPADDDEVASILLGHYLGVAGRLGFWAHREAIEAAIARIADAGHVEGERVPLPAFLPRETFGGHRYVGRFYSELLIRRDRGELRAEEAELAVRTGRLGAVFYAGLREDVLAALGELNIPFLEAFYDNNAAGEARHGETPMSDGTIRVEYGSATPDGPFGQAIVASLRAGPG